MSRATEGDGVSEWLRRIPVAVGYFVHDAQGCHALFMNDALGEILGMDASQVAKALDTGLAGIVYAEESERIRLMLYKAGITGGRYRTLGRIARADDGPRFVDIWLNAEPEGDGSSLFCLVVADASLQTSSRRKLDSSYERLLGAMDNIPGGIVVLDTINGKALSTIYASNGIGKLLHGSHEEVSRLYERDFMACVHPEDRERVTHIVEDAVRNLADFQASFRLSTVTGGYAWVAASGSVEAAEGHRVVYLSLVDFSSDHEMQVVQKTVLENFARHKFQYICLVDGTRNSFQILASSDIEGITIPKEGDDFDRTMSELIDAYVPAGEREGLRGSLRLESLLEALRTRPDVEIFYTLLVPNGRERYHEAWVSWVDPRRRLLALVASDHTEEHLLEAQGRQALSDALRAAEQASVAKGEFLSRMSHDIRTPLNAIMGFTEMSLDDPSVSTAEKERLSKVASSSRFLLSLINDVLDMSRIESGRLTLNEATFSLAELVEGVSSIADAQCAAGGVRFERSFGPGVCTEFVGDSLKLQQVLVNLLGNAAKFTPRGGLVSLAVEQVAGDENHAILAFHVVDTGRGMSAEYLPHLFEPFSQERRSSSDEHKGTGLGLAICHSLVSMMNGDIQVESRLGEGTSFVVEVPLRRVRDQATPDDEKGSRSSSCAADGARFPGKHVLLAEDNAMNLEIARYLLERVGLVVDSAKDGSEALELFEESAVGGYDAVLTDIEMPVMDGRRMAKALRRLDRSDAATVPIIAMSADAFEEDVQTSLICGINGYVVKPIDASHLYETLERYL
ncbi:MAG: ATP-binding protein [Atopobiaceae bacterium]|jgi:signal transduction histidine kinase/PAS domain-containing protein|nr:ATP-binding protein [Atopobiaceae bacterium]